jgi:hypothetical protein
LLPVGYGEPPSGEPRFLFLLPPRAGAVERPPWEVAPFSGDAQAVLRAAAGVKAAPEKGSVLLFREHTLTFDGQGRSTVAVRSVHRIVTDAAARELSGSSVEWSTWRQAEPRLRVRVYAADGTVHELDPKTVQNSAADSGEETIYSDRRVLRAPWPALSAGAVVEEEVTRTRKSSFLRAAEMNRLDLGDFKSRIVVKAPAALPLQLVERLIPSRRYPNERSGDLVEHRYELDPIPERTVEIGAPSDVPREPYIAVSTGGTWADVARAYAEVADRPEPRADLEAIVAEATRGVMTRAEKIARLTDRVRRRVRYIGIELA